MTNYLGGKFREESKNCFGQGKLAKSQEIYIKN